MTLRVAQFSLKIAHLSFSMVLRGPRACGLRPRLWLLTRIQCSMCSPRWGGGGYSGFQVTGMIEWRQKSNPEKNSLGPPTKPKIIPGPKFPERILKMLQHEIIPSEFIFSSSGSHWLYFIRRTTRPGYTGTTTIPRLFRIKPPKKILDKFSYPPTKYRNRKFQTQKVLRSSPSLEIRSIPPPPPTPPEWALNMYIHIRHTAQHCAPW